MINRHHRIVMTSLLALSLLIPTRAVSQEGRQPPPDTRVPTDVPAETKALPQALHGPFKEAFAAKRSAKEAELRLLTKSRELLGAIRQHLPNATESEQQVIKEALGFLMWAPEMLSTRWV